MDYNTIMTMPWEAVEWLYKRHLQELIDRQKEAAEQTNHFI